MVYSLNVSVPGSIERLAADLAPDLAAFDTIRDRHTLVLKRLPAGPPESFSNLHVRARDALSGAPAVEARVTGIDAFYDPATGTAPVVYLTVDSPGLLTLHRRLVDEFEPVASIEGDEYVPHVTLARGGPLEATERLLARQIDPVTWTVRELVFYDAGHGEHAGTLSLPRRA